MRNARALQARSGNHWRVYGGTAEHAGRCYVCQRSHAAGAAIYLA